jgi:ABC-type transporter Mla subunit MlaD
MPIDPDVQLELDNLSTAITNINSTLSNLQSQITTLNSSLAGTASALAATTADLGDTKGNLESTAAKHHSFIEEFAKAFSPDQVDGGAWSLKDSGGYYSNDKPYDHPVSRFPSRSEGEF